MLVLFAAAMFVAATLLFLVQPMFASMVLPLLGGSPSVWNTTAMFFQVALLAGYGYTHFVQSKLQPRAQVIVHGVVVLLPLLVLPIGLRAGWVPPGDENPIAWLLLTLALFVGLPYFAIATTSPLAQAWFSHTGHPSAKDPYFLYAAGNIGSLLGLLIYPFALQPLLGVQQISLIWAFVYGIFIVLIGVCALTVFRGQPRAVAGAQPINPTEKPEPISAARRVRWVLLAAVPSSLMLSVTTYISTDIAAIPMLWVLPLALYLLTFILAFSKRQLLSANTLSMLMKALIAPMALLTLTGAHEPLAVLLPVHLVVFLIVALTCHTLLAKDRPAAQHLTEFYLWLSVGGALGGVFNALIAPVIFNRVMEYPLVLALSLLAIWQPKPGNRPSLKDFALPALIAVPVTLAFLIAPSLGGNLTTALPLAALAGGVLAALVFIPRTFRYGVALGAIIVAGTFFFGNERNDLATLRSFFGVSRVIYDDSKTFRMVMHGTTVHGIQSTDPAKACEPLSYYTKSGPAGQALAALVPNGAPSKFALVGLGAGSLAGYAQPGQEWTFYEIDPVVEHIAQDPRYFSFLSQCAPQATIVLGDGRLKLAQAADAHYDVIVLDAYSSDALPVHLLTREALEQYAQKLGPDGVMMFNISNRYFDLRLVLGNLAQDMGFTAIYQADTDVADTEKTLGKAASSWVVMARNPAVLKPLINDMRWKALQPHPATPLWTDSYSSLLTILK